MPTEPATESSAATPESVAKSDTALTTDTTQKQGTEAPLAPSAAPALPRAWMNGLTSEQKANSELIKGLSSFERGIPDLVEHFAAAEAAKGKAIVVPSEGATKEEVAAFRKAVGVPEKPEDYKLEKPKTATGFEADPEFEARLKTVAHKFNISQGQLTELYKWYHGELAEAMKYVKLSPNETHAILRKKMNAAEYEANKTYVKRFNDTFLEKKPALALALERTGIGNLPEMWELAAEVQKAISDHVFAEGSRGEKPESGIVGARTDAELAAALWPDKK